MRTIIAGSRQITDETLISETLARLAWPITEVISGGTRNMIELARHHHLQVHVEPLP